MAGRNQSGCAKFWEPLYGSRAIHFEGTADGVRTKQPNEELEDGALLRLAQTGDEEAFVVLYRRHQGAVFRFAMHMSGRRETAEEVTQETFLTLIAERQLYDEARGALQGYLIGIARNHVRRVTARERSFQREALSASAGQPDLLGELTQEQEIASLRAAILRLPPTYREVLVLCDLEDVPYADAAQQLGCAIGTIRSRLHRARAILAARLRKRESCAV